MIKYNKTFEQAKKAHPELMNELLALEYVLTWGFTDDYKRDNARHIEIQKIIYA